MYYNWRYYNTVEGRWLVKDLIGEKEKYLLYAYGNNSPYNDKDYLGLSVEWEEGNVRDIVVQSYNLTFIPSIITDAIDSIILTSFIEKNAISSAFTAILGSSALMYWNRHILMMHRHFIAGTGLDYTYMPSKIKSLSFLIKRGYRYGKLNNYKSPIRMKDWMSTSDIENEAYTLKDYKYIVGGSFDRKCNFHYTVYIRDTYDFNFVKDLDGSYINYDNFARLMGGVIPGFLANAKSFLVKGKKDGVLLAEQS